MKVLIAILILMASLQLKVFAEPCIIDKPIAWSSYKEQLIAEYAQLHYGKNITQIVPQAVVVHWTASNTYESAWIWFYNEADEDGTLNVASHFIVDRDGTIYRLTDETALNRHAIGYNWCAIGIENVGGVNNIEDLTDAQLYANIELIQYLHEKSPTIKYVFGHYQQDVARESGLHIELVPDYYAGKEDPGAKFMKGLRESLQYTGLIFYAE